MSLSDNKLTYVEVNRTRFILVNGLEEGHGLGGFDLASKFGKNVHLKFDFSVNIFNTSIRNLKIS